MVARLRRMHTVTNIYLVVIAFADLLLGVFVPGLYIPSYHSSPVSHHIPFDNDAFCYGVFFTGDFGYLLSVSTITLVSFERYLAVCRPLLHLRLQSKRRAVKMIISVAVISAALASGAAASKGKLLKFCIDWPDRHAFYVSLPTHFHTCQPMGASSSVREIFVMIAIWSDIGSVMAALVINSILYGFIIHALSTRTVAASTESSSQQQNQTVIVRNQVARTLVINGVAFLMTQTPYRMYSFNVLIQSIRGVGFLNRGQAITCITVGRLGLYINSAINSFIYAFSCQFYRQGFREAFSFSFKKNPGREKVSFIGKKHISINKI